MLVFSKEKFYEDMPECKKFKNELCMSWVELVDGMEAVEGKDDLEIAVEGCIAPFLIKSEWCNEK